MALLGEMTLQKGKIIMSKNASNIDGNGYMHAISYAAQSPWQSIKDDILFGYPFDEERVNAVVECCAPKPDLESLEDGNATEIGARGVGLLGGQNMKYVLLDGPLSAVVSCPVILPV